MKTEEGGREKGREGRKREKKGGKKGRRREQLHNVRENQGGTHGSVSFEYTLSEVLSSN